MGQPRVMLLGWDAADWKIISPLLDAGELPVLGRLVQHGVIGDLATLEPSLSPLLWNSICTGKRPDQHGILGFTEVSQRTGHVRPVSSTSRKAKALWNILTQNGFRSNLVSWFGSHPAEPIHGAVVSDAFSRVPEKPGEPWPMPEETVHPDYLRSPLTELRFRPEEVDIELLRMFVPKLGKIQPERAGALPALCKILAECISTHNAATWLMEHQPWDFMAVYHIGIDHFSHGFVNYHPPKLEWIPTGDFELFSDVVNSGYRLMDLFLGRMLQLAGPETTVMIVSDHGFQTGALRQKEIPRVPTGPAEQHRPLGMFLISGPGIRKDERIYGLNLLDIAPTVLSIFGLPPAQDMPGRVLVEAFEDPPDLQRIPSWEDVPGSAGMHPPDYELPESEAAHLLEHFAALGYVDAAPPASGEAAASSLREAAWNLARVYMNTGRPHLALESLETLWRENPERGDFGLALGDCQRSLGLFLEAEDTIRAVTALKPGSPRAHLSLGNIAFEQGRFKDSLEHYLEADRLGSTPAVYRSLGSAYLRLRRWQDARYAFEKSMELDPENPLCYQGLARVALRTGDPEAAAGHALSSIQYRHDVPLTHVLLGIALQQLGDRERAVQAFRTALAFQPSFRLAHRLLALTLRGTTSGAEHATAARELLETQKAAAIRRGEIRDEARERAERIAGEMSSGKPFLIVSGLPRSGTSLMMQMLHAGGIPVMTDGFRVPDDDNPGGYFEWEPVKDTPGNPSILLQAATRAVKVISLLLPALPGGNRYKVLFMDRPTEEVAASQIKMIRNRGGETLATPEDLARSLRQHRADVLSWLNRSPRHEVLVVDYPDLVADPQAWVERIETFLGEEWKPISAAAMVGAVRPELHRNRS